MTRRRKLPLALLICTAAAAAAALAVGSLGRAGTNDVSFVVRAVPLQLTAGKQGLVLAKFTPSSSGGSATHTTITFQFPTGTVLDPTADPATSSDCSPATGTTITCSIGTVQPGQTVKRFVTFTAGTALGTVTGISGTVSWDSGSSTSSGGGQVNQLSSSPTLQIVDGTTASGKCAAGGGSVQTSPVSSTVSQSTALSFGGALSSLQLPCSWGAAGVAPQVAGVTATQVSYVSGPQFSLPATVTLSFASLPVPLSKFVLRENLAFDPANPTAGTWSPVPSCPTAQTLPAGAPDCLVGYQNGKVITATLLYAGTDGDPGYAG